MPLSSTQTRAQELSQALAQLVKEKITPFKRLFSLGELRFISAEARDLACGALKDVFGDQDHADNGHAGYWGRLLKYEYCEKAPFADSVLFGYLSVDGNDPFKVNDARNRVWGNRDNLFYKGRRWSNPQLKDRFYHFFNILKEKVVGSDFVPVRYWVTAAKTPHLLIVPEGNQDASVGTLPMYCYDGGNIGSCNVGSCPLAGFFHTLRELNAATHDQSGKYEACVANHTSESLREQYDAAWNHACTAHVDLIGKWVKAFEAAGVTDGWAALKAEERERHVFNVVCLYQYHDLPFVIHLFQPTAADGTFMKYKGYRADRENVGDDVPPPPEMRAWAWLAITHAADASMNTTELEAASALIQELSQLYVIEDAITERHKEHIGYQLKFESWYHRTRGEYETLGEIIRAMLSAICRQRKIPTQSVTSRVKGCESLFEKIAKRANGREPDTTAADCEKYFNIIRVGRHLELESAIHDLVGVRIVCVFDDDVEQLEWALLSLSEQGPKGDARWSKLLEAGSAANRPPRDCTKPVGSSHLVISGIKDYREWNTVQDQGTVRVAFDYRSVHYVVTLGGLRVDLPEAKGLRDRACEIQLRSVLAHGWADVAHEVYYKPALPAVVLKRSELAMTILRELGGAASALAQQDKSFIGARTSYRKLMRDRGEHVGD